MKHQASKGFTLLELSIVFVIIAILITGVVRGASMVKSSKLSTARSLTAKSIVPDIDGLVAWYETSSVDSLKDSQYFDGARTSEWYDISPGSLASQKNKLTRTASSAVTYKSDGINKIPSIYFSGTASNISLSSFYQGPTKAATVFVVFRPNSAISALKTIVDGASATYSLSINSTVVTLNAGTSVSTGTATNSASFTNGVSYIVAAYFNGASSAAYVNNVITKTGGAVIDAGSANAFNGIFIGSTKTTASNFFTGFVSEVIVYNRPLKIDERRAVFRYLSNKYKIAVIDS